MNTHIIAEIGINHNGDLDNALALIDAAADAGCQTAKFQLFSASSLYPKSAGTIDWKDAEKTYSYDIYQAVQGFELPPGWIDPLMARCAQRGIAFAASVFDPAGLDFLVRKGMTSIKLSSYSITNLPLVESAAATGLPIFLSTGGARIGEVEDAVETVLGHHDRLTLLHCSIAYPTSLSDCNLGVIETLRLAFPSVKVGYSDHTMEPETAPVQAVFLGATVIEKHITLSRDMDGPDHFFAIEPCELRRMVDAIYRVEEAMARGERMIDPILYGSTARVCHPQERHLRDFAYPALFAARAIKVGERLRAEDVRILRPGNKARGLDPKWLSPLLARGVRVKRDLAAEDPIVWDAIL